MTLVLSKKPRKQRKAIFNAPHHITNKLMNAHLSPELRERYKKRSMPVRVGDTVRILRGEFKRVEGKVIRVERKYRRVFIENLTRKKADGTNVNIPIHVSNIMITQLNLDDEYRKTLLESGREALVAWRRER